MPHFSYNGSNEVVLSPESQKPSEPGGEPEVAPENPELEDFFQRLPANFRWPKPSDEAVAAAMEAVQRMSGGTVPQLGSTPEPTLAEDSSGDFTMPKIETCAGCGGFLPPDARFCVWCGQAKSGAALQPARSNAAPDAAQHHYHHHYHHIVPPNAGAAPSSAGESAGSPRGKAPAGPNTNPPGRAEIAARQVARDWVQACNTKHLDDLVELYATDATVIRSSVAPVRSAAAIREFLFSLLEAGLGDVEMESLRTEVMGEVAVDLGRCKMLVPVAMGKRREERGKYLLVLVRQPTGVWKILADSWSSDLVVSTNPLPEANRKPEVVAPQRKPR